LKEELIKLIVSFLLTPLDIEEMLWIDYPHCLNYYKKLNLTLRITQLNSKHGDN